MDNEVHGSPDKKRPGQAQLTVHSSETNQEAEAVKTIQEGLGVPNLFARILVSRGITGVDEAEAFLRPRLDDLSDPFLLPDMDKGVDRVIRAITSNEKIALYGDYDADGITSTAIMVNFFKHIGHKPEVYLPKRDEGYGLNRDAINKLKTKGTDLLICVDCGSSNIEEIDLAKTVGMDVIVIDHHEVPETMPDACAIINPKRKDSCFPTRELAACGVAFFFLWALRRVMHGRGLLKGTINLKKELDLVALGTVGDMVPLVKDNRVIVKFGMENMKRQPRMWLKSFLRKNLIPRNGSIDEYTLNFIIIPRINATGRVSEPEVSLRFLVSDDEKSSESFLADMNEANIRRQRISEEILREITETLGQKNLAGQNSIVVYNEDWHIGVIGIVAQKLVDLYRKPSIVITRVDGICKGSGRGGDGLNLHETLSSLMPFLVKFGGHKFACGVSLLEENIGPFREAFEERVAGTTYEKKKIFHADAYAEFEEVTNEFAESIEQLSPYGVGNPRPGILLAPSSVTAASNGRVKITDRNKRIWYGYVQGQQPIPQSRNLHIIASPVVREEMGERFIHLNIKEMMPQ
jgi:single-stranded-DNA-specific exonuclease